MKTAAPWLQLWMCFVYFLTFFGTSLPYNKWSEELELIDLLERQVQNAEYYAREENAQTFLDKFNDEYTTWINKEAVASFDYLTNMIEGNRKQLSDVETAYMSWMEIQVQKAKKFLQHMDESDFSNKSYYRMLKLITGANAISSDESVNKKFNDLKSEMQQIYGVTKVNGVSLDDLDHALREPSATYDERLSLWQGWHDEVGPQMRPVYIEFVKYANITARESGFQDYGESWRVADFGYETNDLIQMADDLYNVILPLYQELHAYVRRKLHEKYPSHNINLKGPIPAHLLGNMWAQQWMIFDDVAPYPGVGTIDITGELVKQNYTPLKMFEKAEDFFVSLGLDPMTDIFWEKSMITRPGNREVECHASAEDFSSPNDFRIKMCTYIDQSDFQTIHHEMGHIEYFMQYANQPAVFRGGANSAFHEAIGDTIGLAVNTKKHYLAVGLLSPDENSDATLSNEHIVTEADLNYLMSIALEKIAFLPFGYLIDKYRWDVFSGKISTDALNQEWWNMRESIQGVISPIPRTENDFDAGCKYHVPANVPYIRYFFSFIAQFQFFETMCDASGHIGPLHTCDFYQSKSAGDLLISMLSMGQSKPWQEAMFKMTNQRKFSADALLLYFDPLYEWLKKENKKNGEVTGWTI